MGTVGTNKNINENEPNTMLLPGIVSGKFLANRLL